jgi:hypothetical protein
MGENDISFAPSSHIWFGILEFIVVREGYELDLLPLTGELASFSKPVANQQLCSNELKGTWPDKFSYPSIP